MKRVFSLILVVMMVAVMMTACGSSAFTVDFDTLYDTYESYLPEMVVLDDKAMMNLYGVDAEKCEQAIIANSSDGLLSDEVWLIEAVDEAAAAEIVELAQNRVEREKEETKSYAPDQYAIVEKAKIINDDNFVVLIISPDVDTLVEVYENAKV